MKETEVKGEEVVQYSLSEFIKATRPDGKGYICFNGEQTINQQHFSKGGGVFGHRQR